MADQNLPPLPLPEGIHSHTLPLTASSLQIHYLSTSPTSNSTKDAASQPPFPLPFDTNISSPSSPVDTTKSLSSALDDLEKPPSATRPPLMLLLHGFPELAYSWRHVMRPLAQRTGCHVVALDQRGYGRTTGWDSRPYAEVDLNEFSVGHLVADIVAFVYALGYTEVKCLVGHDFGSWLASYAALMRPDIFKSLVLMSHPFRGAPGLPFDITSSEEKLKAETATLRTQQAVANGQQKEEDVHTALAELKPPRKHYAQYNATPAAAQDWSCASDAQKLHHFLRGYFHLKSADWKHNSPYRLESFTAPDLAKLPHYYVMPLHLTMPQTISQDMAHEDSNLTKHWLPDDDLSVYVQEFQRTGFQGALNWYRSATSRTLNRDLNVWVGRKIECPVLLLNGKKDWGPFQRAGEMDGLNEKYKILRGIVFTAGGHWPQQEAPGEVVDAVAAGWMD
ncbi:MAG: hypothetical protein Q9159_002733 [Coniocarpon cinnabarinum]